MKNGKLIMQSKCADIYLKKSRFAKKQEAKVLLRNLGTKTPLSKIPLLNVLFLVYKNECNCEQILLAGDTFMPELHLKKTWI